MLEPGQAIIRAKLARVVQLREERLTEEARHLFGRLDPQGLLGAGETFSGQAYLSIRLRIEEAHLWMRLGTQEAIDLARDRLRTILREIGPSADPPRVDGEYRIRALSLLAYALSQLGDEPRAIEISRDILSQLGFPGGWEDNDTLDLSFAEDPLKRSRAIVQLNNVAARRLKRGYLANQAGLRDQGRDELERGRRAGEYAQRLRALGDEAGKRSGELLGEANLARIDLELATLEQGRTGQRDALAAVRRWAEAIHRESYELLAGVSEPARIARAALLGMTMIEQALLAEADDDQAEVKRLAWLARVAIQPRVDLFRFDADESPAAAVRYGEACRLTGAKQIARLHWTRTRDRLAIFRGESEPAITALDQRIEAISA